MTEAGDGGEPYRPMDCGAYSELEVCILRRERLRLVWQQDGAPRTSDLLPVDLETRAGAEYLVAREPAGGTRRIRLDRLVSWERCRD